jgi:predicted phosphodiesterase
MQDHVNNSLYSWWYSCGTLRKQPLVTVHGRHLLRVVWEVNCPRQSSTLDQSEQFEVVAWWQSGEVRDTLGDLDHFEASSTPVDKSHYIYEVIIDIRMLRMTEDQQDNFVYAIRSLQYRTHFGPFTIPCLPKAQGRSIPTCSVVRIGAISDNQFAAVTFKRLLEQALQHQPHYLLHAGDAVQQGDQLGDWQTDFFDIIRSATTERPLLHAPGNHDAGDAGSFYRTYIRGDRDPWLSVDLGFSRWFLLDSNSDDSNQDTWLVNELRKAQDDPHVHFKVVVCHIPPFIEYWDPEPWSQGENLWGAFIRERYVPLFRKYNVDLVISGHQHNYQRGMNGSVTYAIIGGAGGTLERDRVADWEMYNVTRNQHHYVVVDIYSQVLLWQAFGMDGRVIDALAIQRKMSRP